MDEKLKELEKLQSDTIEKEKIVLAIYAALAAFSITCLLRLVTLPDGSIVVIAASCFFTMSAISFLQIVLFMQHVLHKHKDLHIGHVFTSSDSSKLPRKIGFSCLVIGFLLVLFYISVITFVVGLSSIILAVQGSLVLFDQIDFNLISTNVFTAR